MCLDPAVLGEAPPISMTEGLGRGLAKVGGERRRLLKTPSAPGRVSEDTRGLGSSQ